MAAGSQPKAFRGGMRVMENASCLKCLKHRVSVAFRLHLIENFLDSALFIDQEGHAAAVQLLVRRGADVAARSFPAVRARGTFRPSKSADPRKAIAALAAAIAAAEASPDLNALNSLGQPAAVAALRGGRTAAAATAADDDQGDDLPVRGQTQDGGPQTE